MRKSLGEKRKEISDDQIAEIVRLYGNLKECEHVKILPNEAFGFLRLTVERPKRVRWEVTDQTLAALTADGKIAKLDDDMHTKLVDAVAAWKTETFDKRGELTKRVVSVIEELGLKSKQLESAILDALCVRDIDAEPETDSKATSARILTCAITRTCRFREVASRSRPT